MLVVLAPNNAKKVRVFIKSNGQTVKGTIYDAMGGQMGNDRRPGSFYKGAGEGQEEIEK
jgi:hypothetical protein